MTPFHDTPSSAPAARQRWRTAALWIGALGVAILAALRLIDVAADQLVAPFDLAYETPSLRTIELVRAGINPYSRDVFASGPFWITAYTPLYHYLVAELPASDANPFLTGRLVSMACMLGSAALLFLANRGRVALTLLAAGAFLLLHPVVSNAAFLKNDPLGLLFSALAVIACERATGDKRWFAAASAACVAAFFAKQYFVAAPVACALFLFLRSPARGLRFAALTAAAIGAAVLLAIAVWGEGFWFSCFVVPRNPSSLAQFREQWAPMLQQPVFVASAGLALLTLIASGRAAWTRSPYPLWAAASAAVLLATLGKIGSSTNYFLELALALLFTLVRSLRDAPRAGPLALAPPAAAILLLAAGTWDWARAPRSRFAFTDPDATRQHVAEMRAVAADIHRVTGSESPRILNLVHANAPLTGDIRLNDPWLYSELWSAGRLDARPLVAALERCELDGVLAPKWLRLPQEEWPQDVQRAVLENYHSGLDLGEAELWIPAHR